MKKQIFVLSITAFCLTLFLTSCIKKDKGTDNYDTEATYQSDDQTQFSAQIDGVADETSVVLESTGTLAQRGDDIQTLVCNATVTVDSSNAIRTATITYNGADCLGRFNRTGVVTISIPAGVHWKDAGATITVHYQDLVFTNIGNGRSITINGSHTITNVSGGLLYTLPTVNSITHTITSAGMSVKFGNGDERTWMVARKRVFTYNNGVVVTVTGTHTEGNITNIAEWGTNRSGHSFISAISEPLVFRQDCNFRLTSGMITHTLPLFTASATFGLDQSGNPTSCPGSGHYYVKVEWAVSGGATHTAIYPY